MAYGNFGGFGGANLGNLMRQAQKMQEDMMKAKKELEESEFSSSVGGGMVEAKMMGSRQLKSIKINPQVVDPDDVEMLEDLVLSAVNEAIRQADEMYNSEMSKVTGGLGGGLF